MAGYTRQSVADIINGANITAPPLNAEFNQILAAFNSSTGHSHDGSTGNAPKIPLTTSVSGYLPVVHGGVGGRNNTTATSDPTATNDNTEGYAPGSLWINASTGYTHLCLYNTTNNANWVTLVAASFGTGIIAPKVTNTVDIGTATLQFKDVYVDGVGYIDDINAETMSSTGNTDVGGALAVTGNTTVGGTLGVTGLSTLASLGVTTTLTVGGSVGITGNTIMSGNLTVNGNTTIGNAASDTVTVTADVASHLIPSADSTYDLGATGSEWRNLYIDGTAKIDVLEADTADIDGGSVDGTTVGAGTPASGSFAGLTATGTVNLSGATVSNLGAVTTADINGGTVDGVTLGTNSAVTEAQIDNININGNAITSTNSNGNIDLTPAGSGEVNISKVDINSGAIDGTTIGSSSASSGAFTTVSTSGQATLATVDINGGVIDGTAIGSTTEASGAFTTLTSSGGITGSLSGNVTGNVTGNITGNVTGDLTGDVTGDVTGNITASSGLSTFNNVVVNGTANFTNTALTNVVDPTNAQDAATKNYVDTNDALKVTKAGDGMTGNLTMSGGAKVTGLPTPTANSDAATKGYVDTEVANLVDSAPGALDTLNELADALGDDPNFSATISAEIATKLPKAGGTMTGAIAMSTNKLTGVGNPTAAQDAATKSYVDTNDALKLNLTGGTMSGAIAMGSNKVTGVTDPTANQDASTKAYTDAQRDTRLATAGGTMTGNISIGTNKITTSADPVNADDLARKSYVDTIHGSAVAAATSATNSANSATASANSASAASTSETNAANSAASSAASYDLFDDRFLGAKSSAPTTDNDGGSLVIGTLYFDTTAQIMKVYGSSGWQSAGSAVNGTSERYKYTATNNQTTFSGADDNSNALGYDAGFLDVFLSGIRLVNGTDFTATSGTSIQLASGAATGDILEVVTYGTFVLSNQSLTDMTDVNTGGVSTNDVLAYNGTNFVPVSSLTLAGLNSSAAIISTSNSNSFGGTTFNGGITANAGLSSNAAITSTSNSNSFGGTSFTQNVSVAGTLNLPGGLLNLGQADSSSGHINSFELMTFNIDTDNDDTNRYFRWYNNAGQGNGTQLMSLDESANLTVAGKTTTNELDLTAIAQSKSDTAVDVFVYDTSKDSDGGAWRHRTQGTSWYNETLSTSTRGATKKFPSVAVIVLERNKTVIYDGDDPDMPMWMTFINAGGGSGIMLGENANKCVTMLNGIISVGSAPHDLYVVNFIKDNGGQYSNNTAISGYYRGNIAQRNVTTMNFNVGTLPNIIDRTINDVAMTVLPNAPIDADTGLPVPTIAVATENGVSVIKDDGSVVDFTNSSGSAYSRSMGVSFTKNNQIRFMMDASDRFYRTYNIPEADVLVGQWSATSDQGLTVYTSPAYGDVPNIDYQTIGCVEENAVGGDNGLLKFEQNDPTPAASLFNYITSDYNTGWMVGNTKLATLSDTDDTNVTRSELVTNGDFATDSDWNKGSAWTISGSVASHAGGGASYITQTPTSNFEAGKYYYIRIGGMTTGANVLLVNHNQSSFNQPFAGTTQLDVQITPDANGVGQAVWKQSSVNLNSINLYATQAQTLGNVTIYELQESDRSANSYPLPVFGTVTKTAVATGADLVAYSGFSSSNYLKQPYNPDLQFGTGDFSVSVWAQHTPTGAGVAYYLFDKSDSDGTNRVAAYYLPAVNRFDLYSPTSQLATTAFPSITEWSLITLVRRDSTGYIYHNGNLIHSGSFAENLTGDSTSSLSIGTRFNQDEPYTVGSLALFRLSATAPTAEQISKMYNDEKHLFQENAQATLHGTSDVVTALAYDDDTELLHAGTSAGRSVFQGLRRVENTTDAVGSAISASNGLVAED